MNDIYVASTWKRLFAQLIDQVFLLACYLPFGVLFYRVWFTDGEVEISLFQLIMLFLVPALYETVSLMLISATPGKWLLGLKVVPADDPSKELLYTQCVLRPLTSRLTFFFSWAIYALAFFRYDRTHLSDWVAETRVVQFSPRPNRPTIRRVVGTLLILSYAYEGMLFSSRVINEINWNTGKADLRALVQISDMEDVSMDLGEELGEE
ncbi:RDD family protein [Bdellovibrio sp. HCB274]|uniref:RDD family protein n=1 Tax=Bdellovibrio sp. HCB274 TaxID=3394361 RepID=UPI0039B6A2BB